MDFTIYFILTTLLLIIIVLLFYKQTQRLNLYNAELLNLSSNIIIVKEKDRVISTNATYSISELFIEDEGYLSQDMNGLSWIDYILDNPDESNIAKVQKDTHFLYFRVVATELDSNPNQIYIEFSDITKELQLQREIEFLTSTDSLTGIKNNRYFYDNLNSEIYRSRRYEHPLSLLLFDIDSFKEFNKKYGLEVGDKALKNMTELIASLLREGDTFCRITGEMFAILLTHADGKNSLKVAQKLCTTIEEFKDPMPITLSFGVTELRDTDDDSKLLKRAQTALQKAQESANSVLYS